MGNCRVNPYVYGEFSAGAVRFGLTRRERDVMWRVLAGDSTKEIADRLSVSPLTVTAHVQNVGVKTGAGKRSTSLAKLLGIYGAYERK